MFLQVVGVSLCTAGTAYIAMKMFCPWLIYDIRYIAKLLPSLKRFLTMEKQKKLLVDIFEQRVVSHPNAVFIIFEGRKYTYQDVNNQANRVARAAISLGLKNGDVVSLIMYNEPAFVWTLLGLLKIGVTVSLINTNLRDKSLLHSLSVSQSDIIVVGPDAELMNAVLKLRPELPNATILVQGCPNEPLPATFKSFYELMNLQTSDNTDPSLRQVHDYRNDKAVYIFTSGTTGLPKPAYVTHKRLLATVIIGGLAGFRQDDVFYITMPLYHSSSLQVGLVNTILKGAVCVLAKKFSKVSYMQECRDHGVTVVIYVGEICRYLLSVEKSALDHQNCIRIAIGNGLRQDIFKTFQERFSIKHVYEFYGSTEGNLGFFNYFNVTGSCGRSSPFIEKCICDSGFYKYDVDTESVVRDKDGLCVPADVGEPGLLLVAINERQIFDGYIGNPQMTESKRIRNVKTQGDVFFNSGDLFVKDEDYNLYFNDRIGDTYRWKGENVSTTEVSNMLTDLPWVEDASVYGVDIPGEEGKAGMATFLILPEIQTLDTTRLDELSHHCTDVLPMYARPVFIRIKYGELDMTSTLKQNKTKIKQDGFNVNNIEDPVFYFDKVSKTYKPLTIEVYNDIVSKKVLF